MVVCFFSGEVGFAGQDGVPGITGATGATGAGGGTGSQGSSGPTGNQGPNGRQGSTGKLLGPTNKSLFQYKPTCNNTAPFSGLQMGGGKENHAYHHPP